MVNGICEAREIGADSDEESEKSSPVDAIPISISASRIVESWDVNFLFLDEPVVRREDASDGRKEDGVSTHEREEGLGGR